MNVIECPKPQIVIPAKAGTQSRLGKEVFLLQHFIGAFVRPGWVPAFAGMTG
jgi:hypothetical protein